MPEPPKECYNCGGADRPIKCKNLCSRCYYNPKVCTRFDPKPGPPTVVWSKEMRDTLRVLRRQYRMSYQDLGAFFGVSGTAAKKALRKYRVTVPRGKQKGKDRAMGKEQQTRTAFVGGDKYVVRHLLATPKAQVQFQELSPDSSIDQVVAPFIGTEITVLADGSPYFIGHASGLRFVFCVQHRHTAESGRFALVTVQRHYQTKK